MSSASRRRCNSKAPILAFGVRSLKAEDGFSRAVAQPSQAAQRGHGAPQEAPRPRSTEDGPCPGCPTRLPEPSRKRGGSPRSRGREPSAAPQRGEGSAGRPPFSNPTTLQRRERPATGPVIARQARDERLGCPPPPQRRPCRSAHSALPRHRHGHRRRYVTRRPSCHPAPSPGPSA